MRKLIALVLLVAWGAAEAIPVQWTISDAVFEPVAYWDFDDGQSAILTGSFIYDADSDVYSEVEITLSRPWAIKHDVVGLTYYDSPSSSSELHVGGDDGTVGPYYSGAHGELHLYFTSLTNEGGQRSLTGNILAYNNENDYQSNLASGTITGSVVPIPAAVWLFGSGLGLLGWFRRRA